MVSCAPEVVPSDWSSHDWHGKLLHILWKPPEWIIFLVSKFEFPDNGVTMLLLDATSQQVKSPMPTGDYLFWSVWSVNCHTPLNISTTANATGYPPEVDREAPLLKTLHIWVTGQESRLNLKGLKDLNKQHFPVCRCVQGLVLVLFYLRVLPLSFWLWTQPLFISQKVTSLSLSLWILVVLYT